MILAVGPVVIRTVKHMYFEELDEVNKYDGIWACSSILHLSQDALADVLKKMRRALKDDGIVYTSFKYGDFTGERHGRYFINFTEESWIHTCGRMDHR